MTTPEFKSRRDEFRLEQAVRNARGNPASGLPPMDAKDDGTPYMGDYSPAHDIYPQTKHEADQLDPRNWFKEPGKKKRLHPAYLATAFVLLVFAFVMIGSIAFGQGRNIPLSMMDMGVQSCDFDAAGRMGVVLEPRLRLDQEGTNAAVLACRQWLNANRILGLPTVETMGIFNKRQSPLVEGNQ